MKKKILTFLCVITCVFSLAACGNTELTTAEESEVELCKNLAGQLIQISEAYGTEEYLELMNSNYKKHENEYLLESISYNNFGSAIKSEYGTFEGMLTTYVQAKADMGGQVTAGDGMAKVVGKEIVVTVPLTGITANGKFTFTFTKDIFCTLTGAEATAKLSIKQNLQKAGKGMGTAALNTVIGMGTVFIVLILISYIISAFSLLQKKPRPVEVKAPEENKETAVEEELVDDTELVAVIMAAISAYEGNTSTDGFVVRSIRRANRRN